MSFLGVYVKATDFCVKVSPRRSMEKILTRLVLSSSIQICRHVLFEEIVPLQ